MTRRILTIGAALVLAVLGAVGVLSYAHQADQRALAGLRAVSAYVATGQIPAGTSVSTAVQQGLLASQRFPASSVPADAVTSVTSGVSGQVLTSQLASGQLLLRPMLGARVASASSLSIPAGMVGVSLSFTVERAVANYVTPGSEVAVFDTFINVGGKTLPISLPGILSSKTPRGIHTRLVLPKVLVVAVGEGTGVAPTAQGTNVATDPSANSSSSSSSTASTIYVTLAVDRADAERLIELAQQGSPYLALVTSASNATADYTFQP